MAENSGVQWVSRFPGSVSLDDLVDPFKTNAKNFVGALLGAGGDVTISATYRPPERAYLMHWCCLIRGYKDRQGVFHQTAPQDVPAMPGVDIDWTCGGNLAKALNGANAMAIGYKIAFPAALISRHTQRLAVDMTILLRGTFDVIDGDGNTVHFVGRADGTDPRIIAIGKSYGVIKLLSDPPHWSNDGH